MGAPASSAATTASAAPRGAPVPGWPTSIRRMPSPSGKAPVGSTAARALAAAMTSITRKGGAAAPRPTLRGMALLVDRAQRDADAARVGDDGAAVRIARQVVRAGGELGPRRLRRAALDGRRRRRRAQQLQRRGPGDA